MLTDEMKVARVLANKSMREAGDALGLTGEAYRLREIGVQTPTGAELALLARLYGGAVADLFPSYQPSEGEQLFAVEFGRAA